MSEPQEERWDAEDFRWNMAVYPGEENKQYMEEHFLFVVNDLPVAVCVNFDQDTQGVYIRLSELEQPTPQEPQG